MSTTSTTQLLLARIGTGSFCGDQSCSFELLVALNFGAKHGAFEPNMTVPSGHKVRITGVVCLLQSCFRESVLGIRLRCLFSCDCVQKVCDYSSVFCRSRGFCIRYSCDVLVSAFSRVAPQLAAFSISM